MVTHSVAARRSLRRRRRSRSRTAAAQERAVAADPLIAHRAHGSVQSASVVQCVEQMQPGEKPPQHTQLVLAGHRIPSQLCHVQRKPEPPSLAPPSRCAGAQLQVGV